MMPPLARVFVERSVAHTTMTRRVLERLPPGVPVETIDSGPDLMATRALSAEDVSRGKRELLLAAFRGEAIKPCPGTPRYLCCQYQILNYATGCPFDCAYCILQGFFSNPILTLQADTDAFLEAARRALASRPDKFFRLGTGEYADSMALEPLTDYGRILVDFVRDIPNAILELKTKADGVESILDADHGGRTVCAWSMNAPEVARRDELGAAPIAARLRAAARCEAAGYRLAFHFDPILYFDGWEAGYRETVEAIFRAVSAERIAWISMGCFRYTPGLDEMIRRRFPAHRFPYGEFVQGEDGKMRYPQPLRIRIYRHIIRCIREAGGEGVRLYFCMENRRVWQECLAEAPRDNEELGRWLDERVRSV